MTPQEKAKQMLKMSNQLFALDQLQTMQQKVTRYADILLLIPLEQQTVEQRLWLLGYEAANTRFLPGTEESTIAGAVAIETLAECIPE